MKRIFILLLTFFFIIGCSTNRMDLKTILNIKQKDEHYLIRDKNLKSMGFEYAQEYKPDLVYKYEILNRMYYFEFEKPNVNAYLNYILFYVKEKNKADTYATNILIPYLINNYGLYSEVNIALSRIFFMSKNEKINAKVWELFDRKVYLVEDFYDQSINVKIDLLYIEIKEFE